CAYCDFYSLALKSKLEITSWLDALELEAKFWRGLAGGKLKINTLYIGGGTPSILDLNEWQRLIKIILSLCDLNNLSEASVEANPSSLTLYKDLLKFWRENFITRVSLGVQSLNDQELKILGRIHDAKMALSALDLIINSGLNANADLIFSIPNQDLRSWSKSLKLIINAGVTHISAYNLTLEPDTPLGKIYSEQDLPNGYKFYRYAQWLLPKKNFAQYEISNFALKNFECLHNKLYWNQENVLALGPAASGYIDGLRYKNPESLSEYYKNLNNFKNFEPENFLNDSGAEPENFFEAERDKNFKAKDLYLKNIFASAEVLDLKAKAVECAILNLRTREGINKFNFINKFGEYLFNKVKNILLGLPENLLIINDESLALSPAGMRVGNAVWTELMDL
ncbi:MAG: coproporphyrinogen III oxidase family protein, partial [Synergistaceae bacterium]|nr:coproporphyrinogen III oxidase family protein [Synergistaceae bacterium]